MLGEVEIRRGVFSGWDVVYSIGTSENRETDGLVSTLSQNELRTVSDMCSIISVPAA